MFNQSLAKVGRTGCGEVVLDAHPHRAVHRERAKRIAGDPADFAGLVAGGGVPPSGRAVNTTENSWRISPFLVYRITWRGSV
jgi:hypothetical protein